MRSDHVYPLAERPQAEVLMDGRWLPAEIRMLSVLEDGSRVVNLSYQTRPSETRLATVPVEQTRPVDEYGRQRYWPA